MLPLLFDSRNFDCRKFLRFQMMRARGMKLKTRIIVFTICVCLCLIAVLVLDLPGGSSSYKKNGRYYEHGFGYVQGQIEDMMGWRKVVTAPDLSLKYARDVESGLKDQRESGEQYRRQEALNKRKIEMKDELVERFIQRLQQEKGFSRSSFMQENYLTMTRSLGRKKRASGEKTPYFKDKQPFKDDPNYKKFFYGISHYAMYDPDDPAIDGLLNDMATLPFMELEMMEKGTELKLFIQFTDGGHAVFKPMRWGRDHETLPNHFYFNDYERHNAEIAAFHLDRLLGFYRVPPVVGRKVNMTREIFVFAEKDLKRTFFVSPIGNLCFYGDCTYYCDSRHAFCGEVDIIEGSLMAYLPSKHYVNRNRWKSPYRRSYSKFSKADWEINNNYCDNLKQSKHYKEGVLLTNIIDMHIFDFITGNMDRHHVELFSDFGNSSHLVHLDNGRGFGKTKVDEFSILTPLIQCCIIRHSTMLKLLKLYLGPERLSTLMDESTKSDPIYPILTEPYLNAIDRRVMHILRGVALCVEKANSIDKVVIDDGL